MAAALRRSLRASAAASHYNQEILDRGETDERRWRSQLSLEEPDSFTVACRSSVVKIGMKNHWFGIGSGLRYQSYYLMRQTTIFRDSYSRCWQSSSANGTQFPPKDVETGQSLSVGRPRSEVSALSQGGSGRQASINASMNVRTFGDKCLLEG